MLCQVCGFLNPADREYCVRCHQKLLVLSGQVGGDDDGSYEEELEDSISFDEHLLERISFLEEAAKRTAETLRQLLSTLGKQERSILVNQAGVQALSELLENKRVLDPDEWHELWESRLDYQLLALEKRERFLAVRERILALYRGSRRARFEEHLTAAEQALGVFDLKRAVAGLEAAFRLDRGNYPLAAFLGEIWFNEGELERALGYFERVLAVEAEHYEGLVYGGVLHHELGRSERALELLTRAVAVYPDSFLPLFSLGAIHATGRNLARAAVYLEKAVAVEPLPQALYLLGNCYYEMGRATASIRALKQAVKSDPSFEEAHYLLGLAYLDRRFHKKALAAFREAERLNPKKLQYRDLVRFLEGEAGGLLPEVPGEAGRWLVRGEEALERGAAKEALAAYRRALKLAPDNPTLLLSYALLCVQLNRDGEIEAVTRKVLEANPGEMLKATAYAALMEGLRSQGRYREGNRVGKLLLSEGQSSFSKSIAYYEMAFNLAEMEEDLDEALSFAQRSLEHSPEELRAFPLAALGWVHYKRREYDQAVDCLSRSSELGPSATTLTHLGMALLASGEEQRARAALAHARSLTAHSQALGQRMMEMMRESTRVLARVQGRKK
jgi:tetratricopeptide (TPR) repeat protein